MGIIYRPKNCAVVNKDYRLTIPPDFRRHLRIKPGSMVYFEKAESGYIVKRKDKK